MNSRHCSSYGELQVSHYFFCFASSPAGLQYYPRTRKRAEMDCFACIHSALTSFTSHEKQKWPTIKVTSLSGRLKSTMKELIARFFANMRAARGGAENTVENYGLERPHRLAKCFSNPAKRTAGPPGQSRNGT
jgi:hypothetical protein